MKGGARVTACRHQHLELLPPAPARVRCRFCHLTLTVEELGEGCCPECFEADGKRRYDFEPLAVEASGQVRYRCEACGAIIGPQPTDRNS